MKAFLKGDGSYFPLAPKVTTIGRENCDFIIQTNGVDHQHAVIEYNEQEDSFVLQDLNSNQGTFVNEVRVQNAAVRLAPGDVIRFGYGGTAYELHLDSQPQGPQQTILECRVCNEVFRFQGEKVPRLLMCGHTVCHQCLSRLQVHDRAILCPFDRQPTDIGDSGVWGLKKNFALLELLEKLQFSVQMPTRLFSDAALNREKETMDNKTLQKLAQHYIGNEFESLSICLGFSRTQLDALHQLYARQPAAKCQRMLEEWQKMAVQGGEDPRRWLAKEFIDLEKRNDATWFCEDIQDAEKYKPKKETLAAIETICFDRRETVDKDSDFKSFLEILHKLAEQSQVHRNPVSQSPGASVINKRGCDSIDFSSIKHHGSSKFKKLTDDDVLSASEIDILSRCHRSVGSIVRHREPGKKHIGGTCFRVGHNLLMTAWHVLEDEIRDTDTSGQQFFREVGVSFHCDGLSEEQQVDQLLYYNEDMDFAIFSIKAGLDVKTDIPLYPLNVFVNLGIKYCLIGYGHKNRDDKCIERKCQQVSNENKEIAKNWSRSWVSSKDPNPPVNYTGYEMADKSHNVLINSFLEHGASGSPVIVSDDQGDIYTVAMYLGGLPEYYYKLQKTEPALVAEIPSQHIFEYAVNVHHIYEDMHSRNPALCNNVFSKC